MCDIYNSSYRVRAETIDEQAEQAAFSGTASSGHQADAADVRQKLGSGESTFGRRKHEQFLYADLPGERVCCEVEVA